MPPFYASAGVVPRCLSPPTVGCVAVADAPLHLLLLSLSAGVGMLRGVTRDDGKKIGRLQVTAWFSPPVFARVALAAGEEGVPVGRYVTSCVEDCLLRRDAAVLTGEGLSDGEDG